MILNINKIVIMVLIFVSGSLHAMESLHVPVKKQRKFKITNYDLVLIGRDNLEGSSYGSFKLLSSEDKEKLKMRTYMGSFSLKKKNESIKTINSKLVVKMNSNQFMQNNQIDQGLMHDNCQLPVLPSFSQLDALPSVKEIFPDLFTQN